MQLCDPAPAVEPNAPAEQPANWRLSTPGVSPDHSSHWLGVVGILIINLIGSEGLALGNRKAVAVDHRHLEGLGDFLEKAKIHKRLSPDADLCFRHVR